VDIQAIPLRDALLAFGICAAIALVGAIALLVVAVRQIARLDIPEDADFFETLQLVPITVPIALDLLDMAFDVFSAPISWVVLELLGLRALQMITLFEGLIPGTQIIPTMTIAWFIARAMKSRKRQSRLREALREYQLSGGGAYGRLGDGRPLAERYKQRALLAPPDNTIEGEYFEEDLDEPPPDYFEEDL